MGTASKHALARERKIYIEAEGTYGTMVFPAGTDAVKVLSCDLGSQAIAREDRADNRTTRSVQERITGNQGPSEWSVEMNLIPSGTLGTAPDATAFLKAVMGYEYTNVGAAIFTGVGVDDATAAGTFNGSTTRDYLVEVDAKAAPDTFRWSVDNGSTWEASTVPMTGAAVTLDSGVTIAHTTFTNSHTVGDQWRFVATDGVAYRLTDVQGTQESLTIHDNVSDTELEAVDGAIVQEVTMKGAGGDAPTVSFSGVAADHVTTARTTLDGALTGSDVTCVVDHAEAGDVGSLIQIGDQTNSGNGHQVTARGKGIGAATQTTGSGADDATSSGTYTGTTDRSVYTVEIDAEGTPDTFKWRKDSGAYTSTVAITGAAQVLGEGVSIAFTGTDNHTLGDIWTINVGTQTKWTFTPAISAVAQADGVVIRPRTPTETTAGSPAPGTLGACTLDGDTFPCMSWEWTLNNNHMPFHDEAFQPLITDFSEDVREVTGSLTVRAREDQVRWLGRRAEFATMPLVITVGTVAGKILTITFPTVELEFNPVEKPAQGSSTITLPFKALGTNNELELEFS